jgi:hypothetical protein
MRGRIGVSSVLLGDGSKRVTSINGTVENGFRLSMGRLDPGSVPRWDGWSRKRPKEKAPKWRPYLLMEREPARPPDLLLGVDGESR